jgi:hypothetical protein
MPEIYLFRGLPLVIYLLMVYLIFTASSSSNMMWKKQDDIRGKAVENRYDNL